MRGNAVNSGMTDEFTGIWHIEQIEKYTLNLHEYDTSKQIGEALKRIPRLLSMMPIHEISMIFSTVSMVNSWNIIGITRISQALTKQNRFPY